MTGAVLEFDNIWRKFRQGDALLEVLKGASLTVRRGEIVGLTGASGTGKSTLLHILGLLERADAGDIWIEGKPCADMDDRSRTRTRRTRIGFVYQFHHLLPEFTALENVALAPMIAGLGKQQAQDRARELLAALGLAERLTHRPAELSGGEQQRVAIARALANRPALILADEPTGNLDEATADAVFEELLRVARDHGVAAVIATHNTALARRMDRHVRLHNGILMDGGATVPPADRAGEE